MNPARVTDEDDIQCLIATPKVCSATEASRVKRRIMLRLPTMRSPGCCTAWNRMLGPAAPVAITPAVPTPIAPVSATPASAAANPAG